MYMNVYQLNYNKMANIVAVAFIGMIVCCLTEEHRTHFEI